MKLFWEMGGIWGVIGAILILGLIAFLNGDPESMIAEIKERRANTKKSNSEHLKDSLELLIALFKEDGNSHWPNLLQKIRTDLDSSEKIYSALQELSSMFGGMCSLNDVAFNDETLSERGNDLLDSVFKDMKLYYHPLETREEWMKLEEENKDGLPPRIQHALSDNSKR